MRFVWSTENPETLENCLVSWLRVACGNYVEITMLKYKTVIILDINVHDEFVFTETYDKIHLSKAITCYETGTLQMHP